MTVVLSHESGMQLNCCPNVPPACIACDAGHHERPGLWAQHDAQRGHLDAADLPFIDRQDPGHKGVNCVNPSPFPACEVVEERVHVILTPTGLQPHGHTSINPGRTPLPASPFPHSAPRWLDAVFVPTPKTLLHVIPCCCLQFLDMEVAQVQVTTQYNLVNGAGGVPPSAEHAASLRGRR